MLNLLSQVAANISLVANSVAKVSNAIGTLIVLGLVLIVDYDVVARGLFNRPFMGAIEVVQFAMVLIVFLQLPDVVRVNRLTRSDGFLTIIGPKYPRLASAVRRIINTVSAILMTLVAIALWPEFLDMFETKDYFGVPGVFTAPWWPIKLTIVLSSALCAILFTFKVIHDNSKLGVVHMEETKEKPSNVGRNS